MVCLLQRSRRSLSPEGTGSTSPSEVPSAAGSGWTLAACLEFSAYFTRIIPHHQVARSADASSLQVGRPYSMQVRRRVDLEGFT
mmetsp:Transcript_30080/g.75918  ORF Transcript_30080/g.75918 Transcript_30080/m.75918 type:complete len:84 (-) Transcript_30080:253-504(-)